MLTKEQGTKSGRLTADERRTQILETATLLFSRLGYQRTTLRILADECGITEPAVYRYFSSKDALYHGVLDALSRRLHIGELFKRLEKVDDIEELLYGLAQFIVTNYSRHTELSRLLLLSLLEGHPQAEATFRSLRLTYVEFLTGRLVHLIQEGKIRPIQPEITARCFVGMVMDCALGMHLWADIQGKRYQAEKVMRNNVPIYARGLRPDAVHDGTGAQGQA